jgi:hypothetical protein
LYNGKSGEWKIWKRKKCKIERETQDPSSKTRVGTRRAQRGRIAVALGKGYRLKAMPLERQEKASRPKA